MARRERRGPIRSRRGLKRSSRKRLRPDLLPAGGSRDGAVDIAAARSVGAAFLGQALHPVGLKNRVLYLLGIRYSV